MEARTTKANMEETSRKEYEEDWVESGGGYRSCEIREGERAIAEGMRCIRPPSDTRNKPD